MIAGVKQVKQIYWLAVALATALAFAPVHGLANTAPSLGQIPKNNTAACGSSTQKALTSAIASCKSVLKWNGKQTLTTRQKHMFCVDAKCTSIASMPWGTVANCCAGKSDISISSLKTAIEFCNPPANCVPTPTTPTPTTPAPTTPAPTTPAPTTTTPSPEPTTPSPEPTTPEPTTTTPSPEPTTPEPTTTTPSPEPTTPEPTTPTPSPEPTTVTPEPTTVTPEPTTVTPEPTTTTPSPEPTSTTPETTTPTPTLCVVANR